MLPCRAAGGVKKRRRRDEKAEPAARARIPRGPHCQAVSGLPKKTSRIWPEKKSRKRRGLFGESQIAFDADHPSRRDLPVPAQIRRGAERRAVERLAGRIAGKKLENGKATFRHRCRGRVGARG